MKILLLMETNALAKCPIGIFDSGLGGLTVLKSLEKILSNESFIYVGDTAHVPYGNKSAETVINYSKNIIKFFLSHNTKLIIIACNTASSVAYNRLCAQFDVPIFNVVEPSVIYSNKISKSRKVGIIGTRTTICSGSYRKSFLDIKSDCSIIETACPLFVPLIEEGWSSTPVAEEIAKTYLSKFHNSDIDVLILGCTHYPIMAKTIEKVLNFNISLVYSGSTVGNSVSAYLKNNNCKNTQKNDKSTKFYVTDFPQKFDEIGSRFLGRTLNYIEHISFL